MQKKRIAILMGGWSAERHVSVESGRNIYEKLSSSDLYDPIPIFLTGSSDAMRFFILSINCLLKDNAEDIKNAILVEQSITKKKSLYFAREINKCITNEYGQANYNPLEINFAELKQLCDFVFIALHGHPGEDGVMQRMLDGIDLPYNGSGKEASFTMMNKVLANKILKKNCFKVANQLCIAKHNYIIESTTLLKQIAEKIKYPCIAKPVDDGCSAGVEKIFDEKDLIHYIDKNLLAHDAARSQILVEEFISKGEAKKIIEVTCGVLTHYSQCGKIEYEVFQPSESIATGDILSLEEKFLAGEGQNITPARFSIDKNVSAQISFEVAKEVERAAKVLNVMGYARIDAFVKIFDDLSIETWIIEANSLPALTPATCIFHQCILNNYKPIDFLSQIIKFGFQTRFYEKSEDKHYI